MTVATGRAATAGTPAGIVWLASYPKSGNTWTRAFLHNLLDVVKGEAEGVHDINAMGQYTTWEIGGEAYRKLLGPDLKAAGRARIAAARPRVQQELADAQDAVSFVKTHNALVVDRGHPTINLAVTSGVIYLVRNPLDVCISFASHMGATIDDAITAMETPGYETAGSDKAVFEVYGSWSEHVYSWTRRPNRALYVMRYEDMLADPERSFAGLARHLLLAPNRAQLRRAIELSSFEKLQAQEDEKGFHEKPAQAERFFRKGEAGQWKTGLSQAQIDRVVGAHHEQMARFGYSIPGAGRSKGRAPDRRWRKNFKLS